MNILIVEPHFDDAWINLGGYILLHPENRIFILTLSDYVDNNKNGTELLSNILSNVEGKFLGYKSLGFDDSYMEKMQNDYKEKDHCKLFLKINNLTSLTTIKKEIKKYADGKDLIFWPLGLKHPQHIIMDQINPFASFCYYREYPYFFYEDQKNTLARKVKGLMEKNTDITKVNNIKKSFFNFAYKEQFFIYNLNINGKKLEDVKNETYWNVA